MTTSVENVLLSNLPVTAAEARRAVAKRSAKSPPCAVRLSAVARREGSAPLPDTRAQAADTVLLCLSPMHRRLCDTRPRYKTRTRFRGSKAGASEPPLDFPTRRLEGLHPRKRMERARGSLRAGRGFRGQLRPPTHSAVGFTERLSEIR